MYCGYVTKLKNVRPHSNADRLKLADCFGNTVVVGSDAVEGEIGVYFPVDGKLGIEFAEKNNLVRKKDENGNNIGGFLDPDKRNIKAIKLRGEKSDGLFLGLQAFAEFANLDELNVGDQVTTLNGIVICEKYIPRRKSSGTQGEPKTKKTKKPYAPLFLEHKDTEQLPYNLSSFKPGDIVEITLKMHGTTQRTAYLPTLQGYKRTIMDKIFRKEGTPIYDWGYVTGTRRVVLENFNNGGYYDTNNFRKDCADNFEGKLAKGETVYYEVVGYTDAGGTIMGTCSNKKAGLDKDFVKTYGDETVFNYGCAVGESKVYVYHMTMTNEDGYVVEYSPDQVRLRCEQMGVETVPLLTRFIVPQYEDTDLVDNSSAGEFVKMIAESYYDGPDPIGKTHIREGIVARIVNAATFKAFKHKNFSFKVLEGIIKEAADAPDMEEAQEVEDGEV